MRAHWSWLVLAGVAVLVVVAGADALRSEGKTLAPTTGSTTTTDSAEQPLARCAESQVGLTIEVLGGRAKAVVRNVSSNPCRLPPHHVRVTLVDGSGSELRLGVLRSAAVGGALSAGADQTADFPEVIEGCRLKGPFQAIVRVGPFSARTTDLSGAEVGCVGT